MEGAGETGTVVAQRGLRVSHGWCPTDVRRGVVVYSVYLFSVQVFIIGKKTALLLSRLCRVFSLVYGQVPSLRIWVGQILLWVLGGTAPPNSPLGIGRHGALTARLVAAADEAEAVAAAAAAHAKTLRIAADEAFPGEECTASVGKEG